MWQSNCKYLIVCRSVVDEHATCQIDLMAQLNQACMTIYEISLNIRVIKAYIRIVIISNAILVNLITLLIFSFKQLTDPVYATIEDTFTKSMSQDNHSMVGSFYPNQKLPPVPTTQSQYRSCTNFSHLDNNIDKNIAYASIVTSSEFEVNPTYISFDPVLQKDANVHMQRSHSCPQ